MCGIKNLSSTLGQANAVKPPSYQNLKDLDNKYSKMDLVTYSSSEIENSSLSATASRVSTLSSYDSPDQKGVMQLFSLKEKTLVNTESLKDRVSNWIQSTEIPLKKTNLTYSYKNLTFFQRIYNTVASFFGFELINPKREANSPWMDQSKKSVDFRIDREPVLGSNSIKRGGLSNKYTAHTKPPSKKRRDGTKKILKKYGPLSPCEAKNDIDKARLQKKLSGVLKARKK